LDGISFKVTGLDCAEEVAALKRAVGPRIGGEDNLAFDPLNAKMTVMLPADQVEVEQVYEAVASTGMKAILWDERGLAENQGGFQQYGRTILTAASGLFVASGFALHWALHGSFIEALAGSSGDESHTLPAAVIALYICAIITGVWHVLPRAFRSALSLRPDMNVLMCIAIIGASILGEWAEGAMVAFLFALALCLEQWSVGRARRAISGLLDLSAKTVRVACCSGCPHDKPVADVLIGDIALIRPGEKIPVDGRIVKGSSSVNQAPITGESVPVSKSPGDEVFAGTLNEDGSLDVEVTRTADDSTLARIVHMVEEAHSRRAAAEQWVEKFARYYTPIMMLLATCIAVIPPMFFAKEWGEWFYQGLVMLVIACPCALVISTPVSIVAGLARAARNGILIKGGIHLETAGKLNAIAMDKTGTLTHGHPEVQQIHPFNGHTVEEVLARAVAIEAHSEHPLARAIHRRAAADGIAVDRAENFLAIKGEGAEADINGKNFWIGSHRLMGLKGEETPLIHDKALELEDAGHSVVALGNDDHVCGLISVVDTVRENAAQAITEIKNAEVGRIIMLTGDNEGTARDVAAATGVDEYKSELLPGDKLNAIEDVVNRYGLVAMVGDGVNDAPAMAASSLGIAMAAIGSDVAIETADIALMSDDLSQLPWLIHHSRRTLNIIKQNIYFALGIKTLFITLAIGGTASLWMAIAADMGASLLVIFNSLRLLGQKD